MEFLFKLTKIMYFFILFKNIYTHYYFGFQSPNHFVFSTNILFGLRKDIIDSNCNLHINVTFL